MGVCSVPCRAAALTNLLLSVGALTLLLAACQFTQYTQTQETPEFVISVTLDPFPAPPGTDLEVYATLRHERQGVSGCRVRFSPRAAGAAVIAPEDGQWIEAPEQGRSGVYRVRTALFKSGGDWELHVGVRCLGRERFVVFNYTVEKRIEQ